jgi:NADH/F420H2 dehydrogenase subunit C
MIARWREEHNALHYQIEIQDISSEEREMDNNYRRSNLPLPPTPLTHHATHDESHRELLQQLSALGNTLGRAIPRKILPGNILMIEIDPGQIIDVSLYLRDQLGFTLLSCLSGLDMIDHLAVVYHLRAIDKNWLLEVKVELPSGVTEIESVTIIWQTANWQEREAFDMFGISFAGHPDLRRILTDNEFEGFPLLKTFRSTPLVRHDEATTQVDPIRALHDAQEKEIGQQRIANNILNQGSIERLHPGTSTLGNDQFHGRRFPPITWLHTPEYVEQPDVETYHSDKPENA